MGPATSAGGWLGARRLSGNDAAAATIGGASLGGACPCLDAGSTRWTSYRRPGLDAGPGPRQWTSYKWSPSCFCVCGLSLPGRKSGQHTPHTHARPLLVRTCQVLLSPCIFVRVAVAAMCLGTRAMMLPQIDSVVSCLDDLDVAAILSTNMAIHCACRPLLSYQPQPGRNFALSAPHVRPWLDVKTVRRLRCTGSFYCTWTRKMPSRTAGAGAGSVPPVGDEYLALERGPGGPSRSTMD